MDFGLRQFAAKHGLRCETRRREYNRGATPFGFVLSRDRVDFIPLRAHLVKHAHLQQPRLPRLGVLGSWRPVLREAGRGQARKPADGLTDLPDVVYNTGREGRADAKDSAGRICRRQTS